jgi:predicted nucleic-acid-binding Zn-ribbon protein
MKEKLLGIAAGLKAAATSFTEDHPHFRVGSRRIVCPICGHDEFDQQSMLMNTTGLTLMNLDWLNASACALICRRCTRIELFAEAPTNE